PLQETSVRVPALEDHLRLLSVHMLAHGAWRPIWLCDVAVALESSRSQFDWDRFLAGNHFVSDCAVCGLGLAARLLGASLEGAPAAVAERALALPRWLRPAVLRAWETGGPRYFQGIGPGSAR